MNVVLSALFAVHSLSPTSITAIAVSITHFEQGKEGLGVQGESRRKRVLTWTRTCPGVYVMDCRPHQKAQQDRCPVAVVTSLVPGESMPR